MAYRFIFVCLYKVTYKLYKGWAMQITLICNHWLLWSVYSIIHVFTGHYNKDICIVYCIVCREDHHYIISMITHVLSILWFFERKIAHIAKKRPGISSWSSVCLYSWQIEALWRIYASVNQVVIAAGNGLSSVSPLQLRHNERDFVSTHRRLDSLFICSGADQRKEQCSASLAFVRGIRRTKDQ